MKCSIMLYFIWVFTVCQSTRLGFPVYKALIWTFSRQQVNANRDQTSVSKKQPNPLTLDESVIMYRGYYMSAYALFNLLNELGLR